MKERNNLIFGKILTNQVLRVIDIHNELHTLIEMARQNDRQAQRVLYNRFSPKLLSICRQYLSDIHTAEDVMLTGFMKIFTHLEKFENRGNFEGWMRRILVNECISYIRANQKMKFTEEQCINIPDANETDSGLFTTDIQYMIDQLPNGCKTVFVLYAVEGYKHNEIAEMLHINEGTSKSQLAYARKMLQNMIQQNSKVSHG